MTGLLLAAGVIACSAALAASTASTSIAIKPRVGIAGVRLNEKQHSVQRLLGEGRYGRHGGWAGFYAYRSGSITVLVADGSGRVDGIDTTSRSALI